MYINKYSALFILTNALTLLFLTCWLIFQRRKIKRQRAHARYELRKLNSDQSESRTPSEIPVFRHEGTNEEESSSVSSSAAPPTPPILKRGT
jgi:cbb3-type cytochrome oxidase subunit 3